MRRLIILIAILLIVIAWWQVLAARSGLTVRDMSRDGVPLVYVAPNTPGPLPGVIIAHGFAGSKQLMLGYAHGLAHAGYATMLPDFAGHGANPAPLARGAEGDLQRDVDVALDALLAQPEVDLQRLAVLGHSMGSGAAMSAGIRLVERLDAVVAISPTGADVTATAPRNLLLQAGAWEPRFVANAQGLLEQAGGEGGDPALGTARALVIIPATEHISILFRDESLAAARRWLDATFGLAGASQYTDRRIGWYFVHMLGWLVLWAAVLPAMPRPRHKERLPLTVIGLFVAPVLAGGVLFLLDRAVNLTDLGGLLVGGAIAVWLAVAGLVWLALSVGRLVSLSGGVGRPTLTDLLLGLALFALLWLAFGALGQVVWLQWLLVPVRLLKWPILALACLPWFLAVGVAQAGSRWPGQLAWWVGQSIALIGGLLLALRLAPGLSFVMLLLPLFPVVTGMLSLAGARLQRPWAAAIGSSLFFGWVLAAAFPLA